MPRDRATSDAKTSAMAASPVFLAAKEIEAESFRAASEAAAALSATVCAGRVLPPRVQFALPPEKGAERRSTAMRPSDEKEEEEEEEESRELLSASRGP